MERLQEDYRSDQPLKEVGHVISALTDDNGNVILRKNGKPKYRASYSILQDELFEHMSERGFKGFQRGELGSTSENLTSLQYQIMKDKERLSAIQEKIQSEQIKYKPAHNVFKTSRMRLMRWDRKLLQAK